MTKKSISVLSGMLALAMLLLPTSVLAQNIKLKMKGTTLKIQVRGGSPTANGTTLSTSAVNTLTVQVGEEVVIAGNPQQLLIEGSDVETADLSAAPASLTRFIFNTGTLDAIDLSGATNLTFLRLSDYRYLTTVDMSRLSKLEEVYFGKYGDDYLQRSLRNVTWPTTNVIKKLTFYEVSIPSIDFTRFPALTSLDIRGGGDGSFAQEWTFPNSPNLEKLILFRQRYSTNVNVAHNPKLTEFQYSGSDAVTSLKVSGATALSTIALNQGSGWSIPANLKVIDLSNNGMTAIDTSAGSSLFSGAGVRAVDVSGNKLTASELDKIIGLLPQGDGTGAYVFAGEKTPSEGNAFGEAQKAALRAKGWAVGYPLSIGGVDYYTARIYPSVTSDVVKIENVAPNAEVLVHSTAGALVQTTTTDDLGQAELSLLGNPSGVYIVSVGMTKQRVVLR